MGRALRVLMVEDSEDDAVLLLRELKRAGFDVTTERVMTGDALEEALVRGTWDVVLSDYSMPAFSAPEALAVVQASGLDLPFIIISGTVGEETAVAAMKAGAHDFLLKDKLARLGPALERELREASMRLERKKMHEQLVLSDRMVSVGTLAAGVAHEINNPLAAVLANLEFVESELEAIVGEARAELCEDLAVRFAELGDPIRDAKYAADRVREIVRDLKLFSRPDEERKGPVDIHRVLDSTLRMTENEVRHRARLVKEYGDVPPVEANESRLGQVFLNLVVNAAQAMPEGSADTNEIRVVVKHENDRVVIEVRDSGTGIPPNLLPHVFEPFFTTKPVGVGTGLGLAICHRIVTSYDGSITVESDAKKGTTFRVELPASSRPVDAAAQPTVARRTPGKHRARVLVVDDEAMVGVAVTRMLAPDHEVTALTDARAAFEKLAAGAKVDIILCNVMMPTMSGPDLHREIARTLPAMAERIVFMTGGAFTPSAREFLDRVPNIRLDKPFDAPELRRIVESFAR